MSSSSTITGHLTIHLVKAFLTHDTEVFGAMDPYVRFRVGDKSCQSTVAMDQGHRPEWDERDKFEFVVSDVDTKVEFTVFDEDVMKDDLVGSGEIPLAQLTKFKNNIDWFPIQWKGKSAGKVQMKTQWISQADFLSQQQLEESKEHLSGETKVVGTKHHTDLTKLKTIVKRLSFIEKLEKCMRCLLISADMSHANDNMRSVYAHARFIVVTNVHRKEFRSSQSVEEGLQP